MRAGWIAAAATAAFTAGRMPPARAEPRLDASAFVGLAAPGDTQLGNSWAADQAPGASALMGARIGWLAAPRLVRRGPLALSLGVELELALATASTAGAMTAEGVRKSYAAPVVGWRAHAVLRQSPVGGARRLGLFAVLGAGGATVASASPFMATDTDPLAYAGLGATLALTGRWHLRVDGRGGLMPGRTHAATGVGELQLGLAASFGSAPRPERVGAHPPVIRPPRPPEPVRPPEPTPEPDPDGDGVRGAADACPDAPEDLDGFEDRDGCPDPDNDGDQIADARDACPDAPESRNGYADGDGCPDAVPEALVRVLAQGGVVRFEPGRARVTDGAKRALRPVLGVLEAEPELAIVVTGVPERAGGEELARRRAEAVKWYLVDQGVAEDRLETAISAPGGRGVIELALRIAPVTAR